MELPDAEALVVGAGVSGLTTAVVLREAGIDAHIMTLQMPAQTTSDVAAAIWYPVLAEPRERCLAWGTRSREVLYAMAGGRDNGVFICEVHEYLDEPVDPDWIAGARGYRPLGEDELPEHRHFGVSVEVPRMEPALYLRHLLDRFREAGGVLVEEAVTDLRGLAAERGVVVNCTGLAAGRLLDDDQVYPVRGQVVLVANPGLRHGILDEVEGDHITYILPRTHEVVLGGTREPDNWDLEPDPTTKERILASCARIEPKLKDAVVLGERVGLRPGRTAVRLDAEPVGEGVLVHNYGHDGSGYSLSWGCAEEVRTLVQQALGR